MDPWQMILNKRMLSPVGAPMDMVSSPQYPAPMPPMLSYADSMRPSPQYPQLDEYTPIVDEQQPYSRATMAGPQTDYSFLGTPSPRPTVESPYLNINFPHQVAIDQPDPGPQSGLDAMQARLDNTDRVKAMLANRLANSPDQAAAVSSVSGQAAGYGTGFNRQPEPARISESARTLGRGDVQGDRNERTRRALAAGAFGPGPSGEQPNQVNPLMKEDKDALLARINKLNPVMNGTTPDYLNDRLRRSEPGAASQYMEQAQALSALEGKMNEQERQKLIADLKGNTDVRPAGYQGRDEKKFKEYTDNYYRNRNEAQGRTATFNVMRNLQRRGLPPSQALVIAANMFPTTGDVGISPNYQPTIQGNLADLAKQAGENMVNPQARQQKFDAEQKALDRENHLAGIKLQSDQRAENEAKDADAKLYRDLVVQEERLNEQIANPATPAGEVEVLKRSRDANRAAQNAVRARFSGGQPAPVPGQPAPAANQPETYNPNKPTAQQSPQYNTAMNLRNASNIMHLSPDDNKVLDELYGSAPEVSNWLPDSGVSWSEGEFDKVASHIAAGLGDESLKPKVIQWLKKKLESPGIVGGSIGAIGNALSSANTALVNNVDPHLPSWLKPNAPKN